MQYYDLKYYLPENESIDEARTVRNQKGCTFLDLYAKDAADQEFSDSGYQMGFPCEIAILQHSKEIARFLVGMEVVPSFYIENNLTEKAVEGEK